MARSSSRYILGGICIFLTTVCSILGANEIENDSAYSQLLEQSDVAGGFVVQVGTEKAGELSALKPNESYQVHGLTRSEKTVGEIRAQLSDAEKYGDIAIDQWSGGQLPYIDNMVNLLVVNDANGIDLAEMQRVLVPNGVLMLREPSGQWKKIQKPRPDEIDDWSHYLHNPTGNAVAQDTVVGPPRHLQWVGSPRYSRHHDRMASMSALVSSGGRMFYIMDEGSRISIQLPAKWKVIARDAFNGTILWKRDISDWQNHLWPLKSGPTQLSRRLVSTDDRVFVTLGYDAALSALDAATGETLITYEDTAATEEIIHQDGILYLVVRKGPAELADYAPVNGRVGDQTLARDSFWNEEPRVVMAVDAESGKTLWAKQSVISPLTLSTDGKQVYFHDGQHLVALNKQTGETAWQTEPVTRRQQFTFNFGPRLVIYEDVVLYAGGDGKMVAVDSKSGKQLWDAQHPNSGYQSPQDLMVIQGLVWSAPTTSGKDTGVFTGRNVKTGEVIKEFPPNVDTYWFHHRCYIAKATENFIIPSRTGVEFVDPQQQDWDIHHWVRGGCLYGVMPCNGLTYTPPHDCACYPEAKLFGFNALAPAAQTRPTPKDVPEEGRLVKGPAFNRDATSSPDNSASKRGKSETSQSDDWPMYRHDAERSGTASTELPKKLNVSWIIPLTGRLTAPVIADGRVYVGQIDSHTLHVFDEETGRSLWTHTIGGRIDSPPTIHDGNVLFGGADGWVYNLDAATGELSWKYRAAPMDMRCMAFEQLESLWPVHGSLLVREDHVFCVAGRSNFLDGGLRLIKLDIRSGEKKFEKIMDETNPETGNNLQEKIQILQMPVGLPDILSADDKFIYMKSQKFDFDGNRIQIGPNSGDFAKQASVQRGEGEHIFAPMGFLDDSWFHRSYWVHGQSFAGGHGGYYQAGKFAPSGRLLVKGNGYVFGFGRKPEYLRWTTTLEHQLFSADPSPPPIPENTGKRAGNSNESELARFEKTTSLDPTQQPIVAEAWITTTNPNGVVIACGGPAEGFAMTVEAGRATFMVRAGGSLAKVQGGKRLIGGWHHLVGMVKADKSMQLYVDGELVDEGKATGLITKAPAQPLEIGADGGSPVGEYKSPHTFTGVIDEVRLYYAEVDGDAVKARYENGDEMSADPRLVIPFDDGSARDFSAYLNNGTLLGGKVAKGKFGSGMQFSARAAGGQNNSAQKPGDSLVKPRWTKDLPIFVRAMTLSGDRLFAAGPLDVMDEEETFKQIAARDKDVEKILQAQDDALEGKTSGLLLVVNAESGEILQKIELGALPAWDSMAAANQKLFLTTTDGKLMCYAK